MRVTIMPLRLRPPPGPLLSPPVDLFNIQFLLLKFGCMFYAAKIMSQNYFTVILPLKLLSCLFRPGPGLFNLSFD